MSRLPLVAGLVALLAPAGPSFAATDVPTGTVAFFDLAACPAGWTTASYATGRLIVATTDGAKLRVQVGTPLANQENRTHTHTYATTVSVDDKSISGADSCCNSQAAHATTYDVKGTTQAAATGLPFIQLTVCEKQ